MPPIATKIAKGLYRHMSLEGRTLTLFFVMWSTFAIRAMCGTIVAPSACRPPLPVDWFIHQFQRGPHLSETLNNSLANASATLSGIIDSTISGTGESMSITVAGPWGLVFEHHVGKLRGNDSSDTRQVDGDSIYRIASITKVIPRSVCFDWTGAYCF